MANAAINRAMNAREWTLLLLLAALWGGSFFFVAVGVAALPPMTVVLARVALAALTLHVIIAGLRLRMPTQRAAWVGFFWMGVLNNALPFCLIAWGQTHVGSGVASILNATTPMFTVVLAHFVTADERLTAGRLLGVTAGIVGVTVMIGADALTSLGLDVVAELAIVCAAILYAYASIYGRRFSAMGVPPLVTATGLLTASSAIMLPLALAVDRPWTLAMPDASVVLALVGLAVVSTAVAYILYFRILATAGATNLMLVTFLIPVSAILLGVTVLGERLAPRHLAGMALIALGLAAIDGRAWQALRSASAQQKGRARARP